MKTFTEWLKTTHNIKLEMAGTGVVAPVKGDDYQIQGAPGAPAKQKKSKKSKKSKK